MFRRCHISLLTLPLLLATGCPDPTGTPVGDDCDQNHPCPGGYACRAGTCQVESSGDAGPIEEVRPTCDYDSDCGAGEICNDASRACIPGLDCSQNPNICGFCESGGGGVDCGFGQQRAFCDPNSGACRRVHTSCQPCTSNAQCTPSDALFDNHCVDYPDGRYCAMDCSEGQTCPRGFSCDGTACLLEAGLGSCADAPSCSAATEADTCPIGTYCTTRDYPGRQGVCLGTCLGDSDCVLPQICRIDPGPRYGTCIDGCAPAGIEVGSLVCHENGRAGAYCASHGDCLGITGQGGFECHDSDGPCETTCSGWCAQGGCDNSLECPLPRTYCDTATRECKVGCAADTDCGSFEVCNQDTHTCHKQPCRGKDLSCDLEQWCCGHELFDASTAPEHSACPAGVEFGACFDMADPYCRPCEDNDDCADISKFGYASYCYELKTEDDQGNEISLGKYCSVGCETSADCPRGIECIQELPDPNDQSGESTIKGCIDARCVP